MSLMINWGGVAVATLVGVFLYSLWYSPFVFGKAWQGLEGLDDAQAGSGVLPRLGAALGAAVLQALLLAGAFNFTGSNSFLMGSLAAAQLWLCLVLPALALAELPGRRAWGLLAMHSGVILLVLVLQGGLLASWR
ncbi:MAG TPA: DUF1761 domain-containing protein [bacterium]|jgi:hypothetical protein|nr:DUF1761 domain-containing protein [bacterium]